MTCLIFLVAHQVISDDSQVIRIAAGCDSARRTPAAFPSRSIPARLEGNGDAFDFVPSLLRFLPPPIEQVQQSVLVRLEFLQRLALNARYHPGYESGLLVQSITAIKCR